FASDALGDSLSPLTIFRDQRGFSGRIVASATQHDEVKRLLIAGFGIGCLPEHSVQADIEQGRLWRLPPGEGGWPVDARLLWHRDAQPSQAELACLKHFRDCVAGHSMAERLVCVGAWITHNVYYVK